MGQPAYDPPAAPSRELPAAPHTFLDDQRRPRFGLYRGTLPIGCVRDALVNLADEYPRGLKRRLTEKRWQYALVTTDEVQVAAAVVHAGYLSSGFFAIFDRHARLLLVDESSVLPAPFAAMEAEPGRISARLEGPGLHASIWSDGSLTTGGLQLRWAGVELDATFGGGSEAVTAIAPVGEARFNTTTKRLGLRARGQLRVGGRSFSLDGGQVGLDATHGLLARETRWRWAFAFGQAAGRSVGFNLSSLFLRGEGENAVFIDGEPQAVGPVEIDLSPEAPEAPWSVASQDGRLQLSFSPQAVRSQRVNLALIASRYAQPFGLFAGSLPLPGGGQLRIEGIPGVTEDHEARW